MVVVVGKRFVPIASGCKLEKANGEGKKDIVFNYFWCHMCRWVNAVFGYSTLTVDTVVVFSF